jgi:SAM-dependent methyltransferase
MVAVTKELSCHYQNGPIDDKEVSFRYQDGWRYDAYDEMRRKHGRATFQDDDVKFYQRLVAQENPSNHDVLVLGCGTGRVAGHLSNCGLAVTGIDNSEAMLKQAREKFPNLPTVKANVENFDLGKHFSFVIYPFDGLNHLLTLADMENCLSSIIKHLRPGGKFAGSIPVLQ